MTNRFPSTYFAAREQFLKAAETVGAAGSRHLLPHYRGPNNEELSIDVTSLGPTNAENVLVLSSGLHGAELPAGSALQTELLWRLAKGEVTLPQNTRLVLVHALNPYGAAHGMRTNENNVDLNRNFINGFANPPATPQLYRDLQSALVPRNLGMGAKAWSWLRILSYIATHSFSKSKDALTRGQYEFPESLFYGGKERSWSRKIWEEIAGEILRPSSGGGYLSPPKRIIHIDFHTGLGRRGASELSIEEKPGSTGDRWAKEIWPDRVRNIYPGANNSASSVLTGTIFGSWQSLSPSRETQITGAGVEFGTKGPLKVLGALRNRGNLWVRHNDKHRLREKTLRKMHAAFSPDDPRWEEAIRGQGEGYINSALAAFTQKAPAPV